MNANQKTAMMKAISDGLEPDDDYQDLARKKVGAVRCGSLSLSAWRRWTGCWPTPMSPGTAAEGLLIQLTKTVRERGWAPISMITWGM